MEWVLGHLRRLGRHGLPLADARQLYLWMYAVVDVLPPALQATPPTRDELTSVFTTLAREGVIASGDFADQSAGGTDAGEWNNLVRSFLLKKVDLDRGFFQRAKEYMEHAANE